jgi:hypothetical protein
MGQGYVANTDALAIRVGELQAVADEVDSAITMLDIAGGDLGPGDISAAVQEVADQWRDGLGEMRDKIGTIAGNVSSSCDNYLALEQLGADRMRMTAENAVHEAQLNAIREAAAAELARQRQFDGRPNAFDPLGG